MPDNRPQDAHDVLGTYEIVADAAEMSTVPRKRRTRVTRRGPHHHPNGYRANYLAALKGSTHNRHFAGMASVLAYARRYTARVDFSSRETADADLGRTNAFQDALDAESRGIRLTLP